MENYPKCQIQQLAPVISVSLGDGPHTEMLRLYLEKANISGKIWDSSMLKNRLLSTKYIINYKNSEEQIFEEISIRKLKTAGEHLQLSPFHAQSDIFPNGILSLKWFYKYTAELPFAVVCVFKLGSQEEDESLGAILASARTKYTDLGLRFVAIVVGEPGTGSETERLAFLRQRSGLAAQSGIFLLKNDSKTLDEDCDALTTTLFNNLKTAATDFYSAIEYKVRQRYRKYYTLPTGKVDIGISLDPKFLEIRNSIKQAMLSQFMHPHNVESSLTILELSYENLIALLREHMHVFSSKSVTAHDAKLYMQLRNLLDIIAVHLIRGYISIEEPVAALRKHDAHIVSVLDAISPIVHADSSFWLLIQYQWLAELMSFVPEPVLSDLHKITKGKNKSNQNSITYYGGITFRDKFFSKVVTELSLLYVKAARTLDKARITDSPVYYPQIHENDSLIRDYKLKLLEAAKSSRSSKSESQPTLTLHSLIDWTMGEEYEASGNYKKAIEHYNLSLQEQGDKRWTAVSEFIIAKIMLAQAKINDTESLLKQIVTLSLLNSGNSQNLPEVKIDKSFELTMEEGYFFETDVFLYEKGFKEETHVLDSVVIQLVVESNLNCDVIKRSIPLSEVKISALKTTIEFVGREPVILKLGGTSNDAIEHVEIDSVLEHELNLADLGKRKIIQLEDVLSIPGAYDVSKVIIDVDVIVKSSDHTIHLTHSDVHIPKPRITNSKKVFMSCESGLLSKQVRVGFRDPNKLTALPYRPDIGMKMKFPFATIIVGEKLDMKFEISYKKSSPKSINLASVFLRAQTKVLENDLEIETLPVQTNWDGLKDDVSLNIQDVIDSDNVSSSKTLWMSIRKPPGKFAIENKLQVVLDVSLLVTEANGTESVYDLESYSLPIVVEPFSNKLAIRPKCNSEGVLEMPNPFITDQSKDYTMPLPSRTWRAEILVIDQLKLIESQEVEVTRSAIALKSKNAEIIVEPIGNTTYANGQAHQLFVTKGKHKFTERNVTVIASATFVWKRKDKEQSNTFETSEWETAIPLQDPRVLLQLQQDDRSTQLTYTIENPTPRIFTFTTALVTADAALHGTNWTIFEKESLIPLSQSAFPVLPFSQYIMVYKGTYTLQDTDRVQLPQLRVYDVNYKVSLPTLPLDDQVETEKSALYIKHT